MIARLITVLRIHRRLRKLAKRARIEAARRERKFAWEAQIEPAVETRKAA